MTNDKKYSKFKIWLIDIVRILIRFMLLCGVPFILTVLALIFAILIPSKYYYNGSVFDIKRASFSIIPLIFIFQAIAQFISYKLIRWCTRYGM